MATAVGNAPAVWIRRRADIALAGQILFLAAAYFISGRMGLALHAVSGFAAPVWPPSGIALASLLLAGTRLWPGIAIGAFFFVKQKPPETIVKYVDRPVPGAEQPAAVGAGDPEPVATGADSAGQKPRTSKGGGVKPVAATNDDKGGGLSGLKGLDGLRPSGPAGTSPGTTSPGSSGGGQLDAAQTSAVVSRYTGSVKRSCWQPALDSRDPTAPSSARVLVTITVGPTGAVQSATTSGDPRGYPGLANCIAGRVRGWQFPATGGTTTVNVPFVFAAQ